MVDSQDFIVTREVALRTGEIQYKYRTDDGRFIVDARTLSRIRFTSDEMINGLQGIEKISHDEAEALIAFNGYQMGDIEEPIEPESVSQELLQESEQETEHEEKQEEQEETEE